MTEQITENEETPVDKADTGQPPADEGNAESLKPDSDDAQENDPETFPKTYVVKLRDENAKYRTRASDRDALAERLHLALVTATGRLADPSDLPYAEAHLTDADALTAAVDDLVSRKPHLASRKPSGDVGQGAGSVADGFSLAGMLRTRA